MERVCWLQNTETGPSRVPPIHGSPTTRPKRQQGTSTDRAFPVKVTARRHSPLLRGWVPMARAAVAIQIVPERHAQKR